MKPARPIVRVTREEVRPRFGAEYHWAHKWVYRVEGVYKPLATLKRARHAAQKKFPGCRVVLAWRESA